jgi:hypothetical protein
MNMIARGYGFAGFFATSLLAGAALAQAAEPCAELDQAVTVRLKPLIDRVDARSTVLASAIVQDLAWARLDCREGRRERAETGYRRLIGVLDRNLTTEALAQHETSPSPSGAPQR